MFDGKSVLITGGTGTFGQQFVQTLFSRYKPKRVVVYSRDEFKQFEMQQRFSFPEMRYFIGDVRDPSRLKVALAGIEYVVHAAALKQVPATEYNPMECIKTNVYGAQNVVEAALEHDIAKVIALSSDKAANPINLYGASKLASDKLFSAANNIAGNRRTRFSVVRYGNVIGSRGSVLPYFKKLLADGASELPVTDPRMTRFWLTLQQGVDFVMKCFHRMQGGETFVPKIPSMRILDLVESLAPGIRVRMIGIRPGEKLHEVMCPADDSHRTLQFPDHYVIEPSIQFVDPVRYHTNPLGERGRAVEQGVSYSSETNPHFLTVEELRQLNQYETSNVCAATA